MGQILGEEVIRVANEVTTSSRGRIRALQTVVSCPGRRCTTGARWLPDGGYEFVDTDPVAIRLSVLMINHIALCGVSGEVLPRIGERFKRESPFVETLMITHANGSNGYLPDAAAYEAISYEIMVTRVKPACEDILIDGLLALLGRL